MWNTAISRRSFRTPPLSGLTAGTYLQYASIPERYVAYVPPSLPMDEAAAVPTAALTAWQARPVRLCLCLCVPACLCACWYSVCPAKSCFLGRAREVDTKNELKASQDFFVLLLAHRYQWF